MFGQSLQKDLDYEHELRIKAEAHSEFLSEQVRSLTASLETERAAHRRQFDGLLAKVLPVKAEPPTMDGLPPSPFRLTSEALRQMPAVGRRGLAERDRLVREAKEREAKEADEQDFERRQATLTEEEKEQIDNAIPA